MDWKTEGTWVTFAGGDLAAQSKVVFLARTAEGLIVVTDRTPFHPESLSWPDQPGDCGWMILADGARRAVSSSREALWNAAIGALADETQKRTDPDVASVVLHLLDGTIAPEIGDTVTLEVDKTYRDALSLQHTGVHLAALALNQCAAGFWSKDLGDLDTLGAPNLDKAAITLSEIAPDQSKDTYRLGKSIKKKGFDREAFLADLPECSLRINDVLQGMLVAPAPVRVTPAQGSLGSRRQWSTLLTGVEASMPCGGTHVADLSLIAGVTVALSTTEEGFVMVTRATAKQKGMTV